MAYLRSFIAVLAIGSILSSASVALAATPATAARTAPSASVITGVFATGRPTFTGTASNTASVGISIDDAGGKAYGSGTIPVVAGRWSHTLTQVLPDGFYTIHVYANNVELTRTIFAIRPYATVQAVRVSPATAASSTSGVGTFTVTFNVTALDAAIYVPQTIVNQTSGVGYMLRSNTQDFMGQWTSEVLSSKPMKVGQYYMIPGGTTQTFTLTVSADPTTSGQYWVGLATLAYATSPVEPNHVINLKGNDRLKTASMFIPGEISVNPPSVPVLTPPLPPPPPPLPPVAPPSAPVVSTTTATTTASIIVNVPVVPVVVPPPAPISPVIAAPVAPPTSATTTTTTTTTSAAATAARMPVIIGVYEGSYPAGVQHSYGYHPEGTVTITLQGSSTQPAQPLVLTAYEPVNWVIKNPNNVPISKIIATGYYQQRVMNAPAPVEYYSQQAGTGYAYTYAYRDANYLNLVKSLNTYFGWYDSGVFYGSYSGSSFNAFIGYKG